MIQGKFITDQDNMEMLLKIWEEVFEQGQLCSEAHSHEESNRTTIHALVYEGNDLTCPVAAGSITLRSEEAEIKNIAVRKEYRGKLYGDFIVRMLLDKAKGAGIDNIIVTVPESVIGFFNKLGFEKVKTEKVIDEIRMKYNNNINTRLCMHKEKM